MYPNLTTGRVDLQKIKNEQPHNPRMKMNFSETFGLGDAKLRSEWNWSSFQNTMTPIFIGNKLLGIKVMNSRISAFVSGFKHYVSPSGFNDTMFLSNFDDKELFEALHFVSEYCRVWKKTISETTIPGFFLFSDISRSDLLFRRCMCPLSIRTGTRRKIESTNDAPKSKTPKMTVQESDFQSFKKQVHHLCSSQILCFNSSPPCPCPFKSKYSEGGGFSRSCVMSKKLMTTNFPPSLREEFLKMTLKHQIQTTARLPYKVSVFSNQQPPSNVFIQVRPQQRLNYDEYLKMKSDELNELKCQQYLRFKLEEREKRNRRWQEEMSRRSSNLPAPSTEIVSNNQENIKEVLVQENMRLFIADEAGQEKFQNYSNKKPIHKNISSLKPNKGKKSKKAIIHKSNRCNFPNNKKITKFHSFSTPSLNIAPRTCHVTLSREFYYCTPPICSLDLLVDDNGQCIVNEFRVGHDIFGHVTFHGEINVFGLDLDAIINFKLKEFDLYPNEDKDSNEIKMGEGLKRPATVVLFNVWPKKKDPNSVTQEPVEIDKLNYDKLLHRSCARMNAIFLSYNPKLGQWSFKINCLQ